MKFHINKEIQSQMMVFIPEAKSQKLLIEVDTKKK